MKTTKIILVSLVMISLFGIHQLANAQSTNEASSIASIQWQKSWGGFDMPPNYPSYLGYCIRQTSEGGYIVAGYTDDQITGDVNADHGNYFDYWIAKLNVAGTIQWQKRLGGFGEDMARSIMQTSDGGYIVAGSTNSTDGDVTGSHGFQDYWIVKLSSTGIIEWQKDLGGSNDDYASSVQQTADGGYIIAGSSESVDGDITGAHGNRDFWIVKLNDIGTIQWQKTLGGSAYDSANSIQQTTDGGYIVSGFTASTNGDITGYHGNGDYWIVKLNAVGTIQWQKALGGSLYDTANSIRQTADDGYIVAGEAVSSDGDVTGHHGTSSDYWIVKLNAAGTIQWQKALGGSNNDIATAVQQTADGGFVIAGFADSIDGDVVSTDTVVYDYDYWIVKLTAAGIIQAQELLGNFSGEYDDDWTQDIQQTSDGGFILIGFTPTQFATPSASTVVKLNAGSLSNPDFQLENSIRVYPNPITISATISFSLTQTQKVAVNIYDLTGKLVEALADEEMQQGSHQLEWNVSDVSTGIYIMKIEVDNYNEAMKLLVNR